MRLDFRIYGSEPQRGAIEDFIQEWPGAMVDDTLSGSDGGPPTSRGRELRRTADAYKETFGSTPSAKEVGPERRASDAA